MQIDKKKNRFLPYEADYKLLNRWRLCGSIVLYSVGIISIFTPLFADYLKNYPTIRHISEFINFVLIITFFIINTVTETFIYPATARLRRIDFIDNSLGSKFLGKDSWNYFSNDDLKPNAYKMVVNCFENCFFTYNISKGMIKSIITKNTLFAFIFLYTAYVGIKDNSVALPILQIFLSSLFITELIHHLNFISKLKILLERFQLFFMGLMESSQNQNILHHSILLLMDYETTLAYNKSPLSDKVYMRLKGQLNNDWKELRQYYKIAN